MSVSIEDVKKQITNFCIQELSKGRGQTYSNYLQKLLDRRKQFLDEVAEKFSFQSLESLKDEMEVHISFTNEDISDEDFQKVFRMSTTNFSYLEQELQSLDETESVDSNELLLCLWFCGSTAPLSEAEILFGYSETEALEICLKFCKAIVALSPKYIRWPTQDKMMEVMNEFKCEYEFPGVIGVMGNLHIIINDEQCNHNLYYNKELQKKTVVLQAVCDNNLLFIDVFCGCPGSMGVQDILLRSPLYIRLTDSNSPLVKLNKHILGGTQHPQLPTLLTPYILQENGQATLKEIKYNTVHYSVMTTIEKTFTLFESKFPRLKALDVVTPNQASIIAGALCVLHNFITIRKNLLQEFVTWVNNLWDKIIDSYVASAGQAGYMNGILLPDMRDWGSVVPREIESQEIQV